MFKDSPVRPILPGFVNDLSQSRKRDQQVPLAAESDRLCCHCGHRTGNKVFGAGQYAHCFRCLKTMLEL